MEVVSCRNGNALVGISMILKKVTMKMVLSQEPPGKKYQLTGSVLNVAPRKKISGKLIDDIEFFESSF
jgi:hypothetical protein